MKVYMSVDMEGISGIVIKEQLIKGNREYEEARQLLVKEVNAAVDGALEAGADEIVVMDAHSNGFNFPLEELHPSAKFVMGPPPRSIRFPFLDESFDMIFLLGYHAMAGTMGAVRDHTYSSMSVEKVTVNGIEMGEVELDALIAGNFGVPVGLVSGDNKVCEEAVSFFKNVETAIVKMAVGRHCALHTAPKKAREVIKKASYNAVKKNGGFYPYRVESPFTVVIDYLSTDLVDAIPANEIDRIRMGPKRVLYKMDSVLEILHKPVY